MNKYTNVAVYVHRKKQRNFDHNGSDQIELLRSYARKNDYIIVNEYIDNFLSRGPLNRPGLSQILNDAEKRDFNLILIHSMCDISRDLEQLSLFLERMEQLNLSAIFVSDCIDTSTPSGRMLSAIILALSKLKRG